MPRTERLILTAISLALLVAGCHVPVREAPGAAERAPAYAGPIIDMHAHAFSPDDTFWFPAMVHPPTLRGETFEGVASADEQRSATLAEYRRHNVVKAVVAGGARWAAEAPGLVLAASADAPVDELRARHSNGQLDVIAELAPFYAGKLADDADILPYFALAEELDVPLGFHLLPGGPNGGLYLLPGLEGMRAANARPLQLEAALVRHPRARVYVMHGGWPFVEEIKALMYAHPQLHVDLSVINWILPEAELHAYIKALVDAGFGDRMMFGSDQMVWPQTIGMGIRAIDSAPFLSAEQKQDIFYDNAARFLRLDAAEIEKHTSN